jgi:hypothetical protein
MAHDDPPLQKLLQWLRHPYHTKIGCTSARLHHDFHAVRSRYAYILRRQEVAPPRAKTNVQAIAVMEPFHRLQFDGQQLLFDEPPHHGDIS